MPNRFQDAINVLRGRARVEVSKDYLANLPPVSGVQPLTISEQIQNNPTQSNIPSTWSSYLMPPGIPISPLQYGMSDRDRQLAELEPRSYQYYPSFNSNLTPRIYLGLMPFSMLKWYNETIAEAALFRRLRIAALTDFVPQIVGADGEVIQKARVKIQLDEHGKPKRDIFGKVIKTFTGDNEIERYPDLGWLTTMPEPSQRRAVAIRKQYLWTETDGGSDPARWLTKATETPPASRWGLQSEEVSDLRWQVSRPDRFNAWPQWLSRFMINYIHYNAAAAYKIRDESDQIVGARVIDGSTLFVMIDPRGETPAPPAPAYSQIIWGTPKQWYNTYQLWYHPYPMRPDSPYGYTSAEDGKMYLDFLYEYWQWWLAQYNARQIPATMLKTPPGTQAEPIFEFLRVFQAQMKGNYAEQQTLYPLPPGAEPVAIPRAELKGEEYLTVVKNLALEYNVHPSELGIVTGATGLSGSKGLAEKGEEEHARIGVIPDHLYVEMFFNDLLLEMADRDPRLRGLTWQLAAPDAVISPQIEQAKWDHIWELDGMTLDEYRDRNGLEDAEGDKGAKYYSEISGKAAGAAGGASGLQAIPGAEPAGADAAPNGLKATGDAEQAVPEAEEEEAPIANILKVVDVQHDNSDGMVAIFIPDRPAARLRKLIESLDLPDEARIETANNLHVTLAFLPGTLATDERDKILNAMTIAAMGLEDKKLTGKIGGYGVFKNGDEQVIYASFDAPALPSIREALCHVLDVLGVEYAKDHGFTPHITLAYLPADYTFTGINVPALKCSIDGLTLAIGEHNRTTIAFKTGETLTQPQYKIAYSNVNLAGDYAGFEKAWGITDLRKHCGVCPEDDQYFGAPLSRETTILFPHQGANETEIVAMTPSGLEPRPALWKPEGGENENLVQALGGMQYVREEAAYIFDRILGFRLVPVAYVSEIDGERGAAIMYVRGNQPRENSYDALWVERAAVLDYSLGQCDRKTHNVLTHPDDEVRPILIDNGLILSPHETVIGSMFVDAYRGILFSADTIACLKKCLGNAEWYDIQEQAGPEAVGLAKDRVQRLITDGMFIHPVSNAQKIIIPSHITAFAEIGG